MNSYKESEESPVIGKIQDDSGYQTNTPLSCEQVCSNESVPACQTAIPPKTDEQATPVGAIPKFERITFHSFKKFKRVLTTRTTSLKQGNILEDSTPVETGGLFQKSFAGYQSPDGEPTLCNYRKRLYSMPNLFPSDEIFNKNVANEDRHTNRASKRLLSIGAKEGLLMYQGWISLSSNNSSLIMLEKFDFIEKLGRERNLMEIAVQILSYLQPDDIMAASKVAIFWKQTITCNKVLSQKLKNCALNKKIELLSKVENKENTAADVAGSFGRRGSCIDIKNFVMETKEGGRRVGRLALEAAPITDKFARMARQNGKWLCLCPKCSHPAQVDDCDIIAQCLRAECNYLFCSKCLFKPHRGKICSALEQDTPTKLIIGSKKSKKNLRRL